MRADLNATQLRQYYQLESRWARLIAQGDVIDVVVEVQYRAEAQRPTKYVIVESVNGGLPRTFRFDNYPGA